MNLGWSLIIFLICCVFDSFKVLAMEKESQKIMQKIEQAYLKYMPRLHEESIYFRFSDISKYNVNEHEIIIDVLCSKENPKFDGMQMIYLQKVDEKKGAFEVSEYGVNDNPDLMYVYGFYKTLKSAITSLLKGNQNYCKRKPVQIFQ